MIHETFYNLPTEKQERIINAASQEFISCPYEKTSINRIIEQAKIPKGSFYQYFDSKEDLLYLCTYQRYVKLIEARESHQESLLETGIIRAEDLGFEAGSSMFNEELFSYLNEEDITLINNMMKSPDSVRNHIMMRLASQLIAPIVKKELLSNDRIRSDINYDYIAYLLSASEMLSVNYAVEHGIKDDDLLKLNYDYLKAIYKSILK